MPRSKWRRKRANADSTCSTSQSAISECDTVSNTSTTSTSPENLPPYPSHSPAHLRYSNYFNRNSSITDSSQSDSFATMYKESPSKELPPIGVFWDIENCQVPKNKSASDVVNLVRRYFFNGHRQTDFIVVCDVRKENINTLNELHDAQVTVIHVSSTAKNAADEKLRQSMRHFGNTYRAPATVVLISSDINFSSDISDLRYVKRMRVILVHNACVSKALKELAHTAHCFTDLLSDLRSVEKSAQISSTYVEIVVNNLPCYESRLLHKRLTYLSDNCGGKVCLVCPERGTAVIRFATVDSARRAQRRLNGEDVYGNKIAAGNIETVAAMTKNASSKNTRNKVNKYYDANGSPAQSNNSWPNQGSSRGDWRTRTPDPQIKSDRSSNNGNANNAVELIITNLDGSIRDLRTTLYNQLKQYAPIYCITLSFQDMKPTAVVKVANQQDAEYIISKMHRQKIGYRRISISYARAKDTDDGELKERVVYLLQESPTKSIPLYLLLNTLETKYLMRVALCDINQLRDVCQIVEENGERLVTLNAKFATVATASLQKPQLIHYCRVHCPNGVSDTDFWQPDIYQPMCVNMSLKEFAQKLNKLLSSHMGTLPLLSFTICYSHEFKQPLPMDDISGVPLEHLITCVGNVKLTFESAKNKAKFIVWEMALKPEDVEYFNNSPLANSISLLRREFIDLLRSLPRCQLALTKFVPAYHHYFGRQLRVADYGYTKLDELLYSPHLSNVVQILGEGANRILTLSHTAQMRRFTSDLLKILKSQVPKQVTLGEFSDVYLRVFNKTFHAFDYGLCTVEDLLEELPESIFMLHRSDFDITIGIPQRVRTPDEILRTKQFAEDVVKLLSHSPNNSMLFDKFVPHYHHHFGYQCKVSDYGFSKLIELFEAIPDVVKVEELSNSQRVISLTTQQSLKLLGNRILELIKKSPCSYLPLDQLPQAYLREYKTQLALKTYECNYLRELVTKLSGYVTLSYNSDGAVIIAVEKDFLRLLELRVWSLLVKAPHHCDSDKLIFNYYMRFNESITAAHLSQLNNVIVTEAGENESTVFLVPEHVKAAKIYQLLIENAGQIPFVQFEAWHQREYNEKLLDAENGAFEKLFNDFSFVLVLSRMRKATSVSLNPKLSELLLPLERAQSNAENGFWTKKSAASAKGKSAPPKPDTPPSMNANVWAQQLTPEMDFSISLPHPEVPQFLPNPNTLISPAKNLLPAFPMGPMISSFPTAPHPSELPLPHGLLKRGIFSDDSGDSGVNNSHFASENELEASRETNLGAKPKNPRKHLELKKFQL